MNAPSMEEFHQKISESELGKKWVNNSLFNLDVWSLLQLGYSEDECKLVGKLNINHAGFSLAWLKLLAKLTTKFGVMRRYSISSLYRRICTLKHLDDFLVFRGFNHPESLTNSLLQEFIAERDTKGRSSVIAYVTKLWDEEHWFKISYYPSIYRKSKPRVIKTIPEEVLHQVYENFDLFPPPLERLFRLQLVLGCRIREMRIMPRQCLKQEGNKWFLRRWIAKQQHWKFYQIHHLVAELIQEQQRCLEAEFGKDSDFDKLFCKVSTASRDGASNQGRFGGSLLYFPEMLPQSIIDGWLRDFSEKVDLKDKHGDKFYLQSHMFRRTKASIMAYCEIEDEYIAVVMGHSSLDMLPHYRERSLDRLEKKANAEGSVDMYGHVSTFKPRKRRYEKLAELLKVTTALGECYRPVMLGDCQYRYACLSCHHHRVSLEDKPMLENDYQQLQQDLGQAQAVGQEKRVIEIRHLSELIEVRLQGLEELEQLKKSKNND